MALFARSTMNVRALCLARSAQFHSSAAANKWDPVSKPGEGVVGVVGLGLMGHGIAQIAAASGYKVRALETTSDFADKGMGRIFKSLEKVYGKKYQDESERDAKLAETLGRLSATLSPEDLSDCDIVIEATTENMEIKKDLFSKLNNIVSSSCIFASNTSSLSISEIGANSGRPQKMVGLHFFNPVQLMKLVEVIEGDKTEPEVYKQSFAFAKSLGKVAVQCKDTPGFIVNRLLVPYLAQALALAERGDAAIHDIDVAMQLGAGHPMGPITLADYVGLDTTKFILEGWVEKYPNEPAFLIPKILDEKVKEGKLGRKTGEGFFKWDGDKRL